MKRFTLLILLAVALVMTAVFGSGCGKSPVAPNAGVTTSTVATRDSAVYLNFVNPMTMVEVSQYVREHKLEPIEVRLQRPGYVAGFKLDGGDPALSASDFAREHRKFLMMLSSRQEPEFAEQRAVAVSELSRFNENTLRVASMTVTGSTNQMRRLPGVTVVEHPLSTDSPGPQVNPNTVKRNAEPYSLYHQSWAPYGGTSTVNKSYSYQAFIFNDLSKLGSGMAAYEHETHIWDKNYANQTGYWASNMPNAYMDCGNNDSVDNFAVGSFTANQLRTYVWYYTYIGLVGQSSASSTVSIWAQRGTRWAWSCWFVTPDDHAGPLATHYAGGGMSWQF